MMLPEHIKFMSDWHFGLWKIIWPTSDAECMAEISNTITASSQSGHNILHFVNDQSELLVFLNWKTFFENYLKLKKNITKYYHFLCTADEPGVSIRQEFCDSEEVGLAFLRQDPSKS
ncbi:hypothetical protein DPMN_157151 [Dreissena polymorpha]|uniref:Uncharacterized protein n=1 Tax=Dreissena polymorpha TaxID=45954 RepID=A0A9D4EEX0_DREPO|nr:hypothetical protein DPMN_157151 [Dreissena polymorpha]